MKKDHIRVTRNLAMGLYDATLFTDGAAKGNPGPGGWGAVLYRKAKSSGEATEVASASGGEKHTTNNRMELTALIEGIKVIRLGEHDVSNLLIAVDSEYVLKGVTEWLEGWKKRGWIKADKKPVVNSDLWRQVDETMADLLDDVQVTWVWVKGHSGNTGNERADELANIGCAPYIK